MRTLGAKKIPCSLRMLANNRPRKPRKGAQCSLSMLANITVSIAMFTAMLASIGTDKYMFAINVGQHAWSTLQDAMQPPRMNYPVKNVCSTLVNLQHRFPSRIRVLESHSCSCLFGMSVFSLWATSCDLVPPSRLASPSSGHLAVYHT